jgi:hypothetical protein
VKFILFKSLEFLSLGRKEVPDDFKSLNLGEISSFINCVEKLDTGDDDVISSELNPLLIHLMFKNDFLFHLEFKVYFNGFDNCWLSFSEESKEFFDENAEKLLSEKFSLLVCNELILVLNTGLLAVLLRGEECSWNLNELFKGEYLSEDEIF